MLDFVTGSYSDVQNLASPSLYKNILNGSTPASNTYNLKSNFKFSINNGLFRYFYTTKCSIAGISS